MSGQAADIFERHFPNQLEELGRVTEEAIDFLRAKAVGEQALYVAQLAMEEMGTNILKYGYDDSALHEIVLRLQALPEAVVLALEDDGHEFNPLEAPEPDIHLPMEEREPGGLGIHLMRKLAEQITYERRDGRNRLTVRIRKESGPP